MVGVDGDTSQRRGEVQFTTRRLLLLEQATIAAARERLADQAATVPAPVVDRAIATRQSLSEEQVAMVRRLTTSGAGVEVVVGKAGTGKTYALATARQAWNQAGVRVTGVALAARAALELQESAGIEATTLTRLLSQIDDPAAPGSPLQPGQVLVVDEGGMIGTRPLAKLLTHARRQQAKVVLVGDPHQLPEIDAGGLFTALATRLPAIELAHNRRQTHQWEAGALDQLRHGDVADAVDAYRAHGRIVTAETADAVREQLVSDWWHTVDTLAADQAVMVALRRADVDDLNTRARTRMAAAGRLTGPALQVDEIEFRAGDRIVCLRNDRQVGVVNGTRATITAIRDDQATPATTTAPACTCPPSICRLATWHTGTRSPATRPKASRSTTPSCSPPRPPTANGGTWPCPAAGTATGCTHTSMTTSTSTVGPTPASPTAT